MSSEMTSVSTPPRWDLSNIYAGLDTDAFAQDFEKYKQLLSDLEGYAEKHNIRKTEGPAETDPAAFAAVLGGLVNQINQLYELGSTMRAYISSFITTDSYNTTAKRWMSQFEQQSVRMQKIGTRMEGWVGQHQELLPAALPLNSTLLAHAFAIEEIAENSKYLMSEAEESLAAELAPSGPNAWGRLQGNLVSQAKTPFERNGKTETLPVTAIINLRNDPNEDVRRRGYEAEMQVWENLREPLAAAMNGIKGAVNTLNARRKREDALHESIESARIDRATLEAMLGAMEDSFPMFRKYFQAKARRLGKEKLAWWDLFAPVGKVETTYTYPQATEFILRHFGVFAPELAAFAKKAFDHNWVDAEMRDGKRAGAFCMGLKSAKESRILLNFDGSLDTVFTLAHELGHGFHNECLKNKTSMQSITPMTLAETASIMCETIVTNAAIAEAANPEEELAILETSLISDSQVIVDIFSRYLFEKEVFERRAQAELSADDLCSIMEKAQKATYGEGLDERYLHKYMWTWKPHYYSAWLSFYNYPYAFGLLFGLGLYNVYKQRGAEFVEDYKNLLASTGEGTAADLAARFGIYIRSRSFWEGSLAVIGERIERYLAL